MKFDGIISNITGIKLVNSKKITYINKKEEVDELKELQYTIIKNRFNEYLYDNV